MDWRPLSVVIAIGPWPVSYTHLDVYKRQIIALALMEALAIYGLLIGIMLLGKI